MDDTSAQTTSTFFKISRAVDGDDAYVARVSIALELSGQEISRKNLLHITNAVADNITATVEGTVITSGVTDQQILEAIDTLPA